MNINHLTEPQQSSLSQLDPSLSHLISTRIAPLGEEGVEKTRLILSSFALCERELHETITEFFLKLFTDLNQKAVFAKLSKWHQQGRLQEFFYNIASKARFCSLTVALSDFSKAQAPLVKRSNTPSWEMLCRKIPLAVLEKQKLLRYLKEFPEEFGADKQEFINQMGTLHDLFGEEAYSALITCLIKDHIALQEAILVVKELCQKSFPIGQIDAFIQGDISLEELKVVLQEEVPEQAQQIWSQEEILNILERSSKMPFPLSERALQTIEEQLFRIQELLNEYASLTINKLVKLARCCKEEAIDPKEKRLRFLAIGICAIKCHYKITLHPTQVLTVLGLLTFTQGALAQVNTGEGKSMITTLLAFLLVMEKNKVHTISSTHSLSIFSQEKFAPLLTSFSITTSHICENQPHFDRFQAQIIYGTASDFEFAIQKEMLQVKRLFPEQEQENGQVRFDCVIVDEVDNLTIDTMMQEARIAYPAEVSYDWVYSPILAFIQNGSKQDLREFLSEYEGGRFAEIASRLPDDLLKSWEQKAYRALNELKEDEDYVVLEKGEEKEICIVDVNNTGRLQRHSRWSGGEHEFIETLHSIPVQRESVTPLSLSHAVYYRFYRAIYGLSGTLGAQTEREEMQEIYQVESFDVPTYLPPQRIDLPPVKIESEDALIEGILQTVREYQNLRRPCLVLCNTIGFSKTISRQLLQQGITHETLNEMQEASEEIILQKAGKPQAVTIATTAGRGTDIILDEESIQNGGLHVLLTFFPNSLRVEQQGRGRAGRQGQPGSSEILFSSPHSLEELLFQREVRAVIEKKHHLYIAEFSRAKFRLSQSFFLQLAAFHHMQNQAIDRLASRWATRKMANPIISTNLLVKDQVIAQAVVTLLSNPLKQEISWHTCLHASCQRVETLVIESWARRFYQKTEELSCDFNRYFRQISYTAHLLSLSGLFTSRQIDKALADAHAKTLAEMERLFVEENQSKGLENYLSPQGEGIERYLRQLVQGHFPDLIS